MHSNRFRPNSLRAALRNQIVAVAIKKPAFNARPVGPIQFLYQVLFTNFEL